jgi:hypothetical protein
MVMVLLPVAQEGTRTAMLKVGVPEAGVTVICVVEVVETGKPATWATCVFWAAHFTVAEAKRLTNSVVPSGDWKKRESDNLEKVSLNVPQQQGKLRLEMTVQHFSSTAATSISSNKLTRHSQNRPTAWSSHRRPGEAYR